MVNNMEQKDVLKHLENIRDLRHLLIHISFALESNDINKAKHLISESISICDKEVM